MSETNSQTHKEIIEKEIAVLEMIQDAPDTGEQLDRAIALVQEIDSDAIALYLDQCSEKLYQLAQKMLNRKKKVLKAIS